MSEVNQLLPNGLSQRQADYLDELDDFYDTNGFLPEVLKVHLITPTFLKALESRDLPEPAQTKDSPLTPTQRQAIKTVLDYHDRRPLRAKLQTYDVTTRQWHAWLKNPTFSQTLEREINKRFAKLDNDAKLSLAALVSSQDLPAIKYFHELTGVYRPTQATEINITLIFSKLMEVLVKFVPPETLPQIADEIERVVMPSLVPGSQTERV